MSLKVRRVITGHDNNGKAVVKLDEFSQKKIQSTGEELEMERAAVKEMLN